ncbi:MAG: GNAT family N-acetyltransferase [Anaerolineales bacterium]|nr:GNAT family N-acetyltransferase [Anaerolineales bacterium]
MQKLPNRQALNVHNFQRSDVPVLTAIYARLHPKRPFTPTQFHHYATQILESNGRIWTATRTGQIIGYAVAAPVPGLPGLLELGGGIAPDVQRQGFGSKLLQHLIASLVNSDAKQIFHSVPTLDTPVARFLTHHHFFVEHEELHLQLDNLHTYALPFAPCTLHLADQQTAVSRFPVLYDESFIGTPWYQPYTSAEMAATLAPTDEMLFALQDGIPFGFAWVRYTNKTTAEIEPFGVVKAWQGQGYGRSLLNSVLAHLRQKGIRQVQLGVWTNNHIARRLYHQFDFQHQSTTTYLAYNL